MISLVIDQSQPGVFYLQKMMNFMKPGVFYLQKMMSFMKMRTFYNKLPLFIKNSILHTYKAWIAWAGTGRQKPAPSMHINLEKQHIC